MNIGQITPLQQVGLSNKPFYLPRPSFANCQSPEQPESQEPEILPDSPLPETDLVSVAPFPRNSVNLISCTSNSGKTHFLDQVIRHRYSFFPQPQSISRLIYVNGNQRDFSIQPPWSEDSIDLEIVSLSLDEFSDYTSVLQANDLVIFDDTLKLDDTIQFIVSYGAHHYNLTAVFIITQSLLSSPLYSLIASVHTIILLFGNTNTTRLAQHLVQTFFLCSETKKYLKSIFGLAEKSQDIVILKLNSIASDRFYSSLLAFCQVRHLFDPIPYCIVYPEQGHLDIVTPAMAQSYTAQLPLNQEYLNEAFVLLPASRVQKQTDESDPKMLCRDEKEEKWNEMALLLEEEIKSTFNYKRWNAAKNLARQMLLCRSLCFSPDARTVSIENKPKKLYSVIDFLNAATRRSAPGERPEKLAEYKPLMQILLRNNIPLSFILNRLLLPSQFEPRGGTDYRPYKRRNKRQDPYYNMY